MRTCGLGASIYFRRYCFHRRCAIYIICINNAFALRANRKPGCWAEERSSFIALYNSFLETNSKFFPLFEKYILVLMKLGYELSWRVEIYFSSSTWLKSHKVLAVSAYSVLVQPRLPLLCSQLYCFHHQKCSNFISQFD